MLGTNITSTVARMAVPLVQGAIREVGRGRGSFSSPGSSKRGGRGVGKFL